MPITPRPPNTIYLGGGGHGPGGQAGYTPENQFATSEAITPGMLVELHDDGSAGAPRWRKHATAAGTFARKAFALDQPFLNQGVDDDYPADELCQVGIMYPGSVVWALVASGQNIAINDALESAGNGFLKEGTTAPVARALETLGAVTETTRVRAEVL